MPTSLMRNGFLLHPWASSQCGDMEQGEALNGAEERKMNAEEYYSFLF